MEKPGRHMFVTGVHMKKLFVVNAYPANVKCRVRSNNARKWQMGFNSAFKGLTFMNEVVFS